MCKPDDRCAEVYDAEYQALYVAAGNALAAALRHLDVDRYDKVAWRTTGGDSGEIDLESIQANDLLEILSMAGLPRTGIEVSSEPVPPEPSPRPRSIYSVAAIDPAFATFDWTGLITDEFYGLRHVEPNEHHVVLLIAAPSAKRAWRTLEQIEQRLGRHPLSGWLFAEDTAA